MAREKKKIIIGNWKMHFNVQESSLYLGKLTKEIKIRRNLEIVLAPTLLSLQSLSLQVNLRQFKLAAQNFFWRDQGAFTGEISATQLRGIVQYAFVGHSERRYVFSENDKDIRNKVASAVRNNISPILCIGETAWERSNGETNEVLSEQLTSGLANITSDELNKVVISYEPVWAVGTGQNALPTDVIVAIQSIRRIIKELYGATASEDIRVLYGGSINANNVDAYLCIPELDGLFLGAASVNLKVFSEIVEKAAQSLKIKKTKES